MIGPFKDVDWKREVTEKCSGVVVLLHRRVNIYVVRVMVVIFRCDRLIDNSLMSTIMMILVKHFFVWG